MGFPRPSLNVVLDSISPIRNVVIDSISLTALCCGGSGCDVIVQVLLTKYQSHRMKGRNIQNFDSMHVFSIITASSAFGIKKTINCPVIPET